MPVLDLPTPEGWKAALTYMYVSCYVYGTGMVYPPAEGIPSKY